jgi:hypothetical protein
MLINYAKQLHWPKLAFNLFYCQQNVSQPFQVNIILTRQCHRVSVSITIKKGFGVHPKPFLLLY